MERRFFSRTPIEVDGELRWTTRRLGRVREVEAHVTTMDLSVEGAQIVTATGHGLKRGDECRLVFREVEAHATVLAVDKSHGASVIRLRFSHPSPAFLEVVEHWLPTDHPYSRTEVRPDWAGS